jgi:hypothetical protein
MGYTPFFTRAALSTSGGAKSKFISLKKDKDPMGRRIRNIWEMPTTRSGHQSGTGELSARLLAGRGRGLEYFVEGMACSDTGITDEQYSLVLEALRGRSADYFMWLEKYER